MITWIIFLVGNHFFKKYYIEFQVENKIKVVSTKWRPINTNESTIILVTLYVLVLMIITHTILFVI